MDVKISATILEVFGVDQNVTLTRPDPQFGDYATSVAMQLAKPLGKNPREIAEAIAAKLREASDFSEVTIAGPGFINIRLADGEVWHQAQNMQLTPLVPRLLLEYSCPNPFKEMHTGHMYQTFLGDALGRLHQKTGAMVYRANFGGDVGLHVGKAMWGILRELGGEHPEKLEHITPDNRSAWISKGYVAGSKAYEDDDVAKLEIIELNKKVYNLHDTNDRDSAFARIYWTCRGWSYDYFKTTYDAMGVMAFDTYYPESICTQPGMQLVEAHLGDVFRESNGAIVLPEEVSGLHTRVFINSQGIPTYETKDLGTIQLEAQDFSYDKRIIMTGSEQSEYMKVVFAALRLIDPELGDKQQHVANGMVKFGNGKKMSSRLGNVARAAEVIEAAKEAVTADDDAARRQIALGALKYSLLKNRIGGDVAFDLEQSVSLEGNSGPYLQYAAVRAASILTKASNDAVYDLAQVQLDEHERSLAWQLAQYSEAIIQALRDSSPHHICSYLYGLSQVFNRFYEQSHVVGDEREGLRVTLVRRYHEVLVEGLGLLGIEVPEKM